MDSMPRRLAAMLNIYGYATKYWYLSCLCKCNVSLVLRSLFIDKFVKTLIFMGANRLLRQTVYQRDILKDVVNEISLDLFGNLTELINKTQSQ